MGYKDKIWDYLPEFSTELERHLKEDDSRWGDTWKNRPKEGQAERIRTIYAGYFDQEKFGGNPVDWLAVAGNALIAWVREIESKNLEDKCRE